jgi:hypothetical protein
MITRAITNCLRLAQERSWKKTYWAFDIHGTMLRPNYQTNNISTDFYPHVIETMQLIGQRKDIVKILYTCSYPHEITQYLKYFSDHGIHFDYINSNPEVADGGYGYYKDKFYFNVLMDDKAGFDGESDWKEIYAVMSKNQNE